LPHVTIQRQGHWNSLGDFNGWSFKKGYVFFISLSFALVSAFNLSSLGVVCSCGFDRAKSQVAFLFPTLDLGELDSFMIVQDGKLVDEP
jgi:hypothetical protein